MRTNISPWGLACQRRTGSVFAALAAFAAPYAVHGTATEYVRVGDQGARFRFRFCPVCGTNVFHTEEGNDDSVAVAVGEDVGTLEDVYEPYLIQQGFLERTPRGRCATSLAYKRFGLTPPGRQTTIFDA